MRVIEVNDQMVKILGYQRDAVLGKPVTDFLEPKSFVSKPLRLAELIQKGWMVSERTFQKGDGSLTVLELLIRSIPGKQVLVFAQDISTRKQAERDLQRSEEKYRRIVETATEGIWIIDKQDITSFPTNHWPICLVIQSRKWSENLCFIS